MIDITAYVAQIEHINQARNEERYVPVTHDCNAFAQEKLADLIAAGVPPESVRLVFAYTERTRTPHVMVEVDGSVRGHDVHMVLDQRFTWSVPRQTLTSIGYVWAHAVAQDQNGRWVIAP